MFIIFYLSLFLISEKGLAQKCHYTPQVITLDLIPLEGCDCDLKLCHQMDSRCLYLHQGEELHVWLKKPSGFNFGSTEDDDVVEAGLVVDNQEEAFCERGIFGWWFNWWLRQTPLHWTETKFGAKYNIYCYQVTQISGDVRLSFISHTVPRYYADLHLKVKASAEEKN